MFTKTAGLTRNGAIRVLLRKSPECFFRAFRVNEADRFDLPQF
jgi:hypothetical protein